MCLLWKNTVTKNKWSFILLAHFSPPLHVFDDLLHLSATHRIYLSLECNTFCLFTWISCLIFKNCVFMGWMTTWPEQQHHTSTKGVMTMNSSKTTSFYNKISLTPQQICWNPLLQPPNGISCSCNTQVV